MRDYDVVITNALVNNDAITSMLGDGEFGVYNSFCDFKGKFPLILFRKRRRNPVLQADNRLKGYSVTYSVIVCAKEKEALELSDLVLEAMEQAGFSWQGTDTEYNSQYREFYTIMNFIIGEEL